METASVRRMSATVGKRPMIRFVILWALLAVAGGAWAIATPLGASPDEPAHIIKAASVVRGDLLGESTDAPAVREVTVPEGIADSKGWPCYAFDGTAEASCLAGIDDDWSDASAETSAGLYNPVFYALVGWPTLVVQDASAAVMGMRLMNAVLTGLFLAAAIIALLRFGGSRIVIGAVAAAITPMVLFLNGSVNPNGLEIATGASLLAALLLLVRGDVGRSRWPWLAIVAVSGVLLAQSRGLSPLWLGLFGLTAIIAARPGRLAELVRRPGVWITLGALVVGIAGAGLWILRTNTLASMGVFPGAGEVSKVEAFIEMLLARTFDPGYVGVFGWLDTPAAPFAYVVWSFLAVAVILVALGVARGRALLALVFAGSAFLLVPPIVQAASVATSGYIWQGRYALAGYVGVLIVAGVVASDVRGLASGIPEWARRRLDVILCALVGLVHGFALLHATKRYAVGTDGAWYDFFREPLWQPPLGSYVWPVLVGVAMAGMLVVMRIPAGAVDESDEPVAAERVSGTA